MNGLTYTSLFAGAGGADLGMDAAGWRCTAQVEWDPNCQAVLGHHWPTVPKWHDVRDVTGDQLGAADAVIFGSPCQDLSVAGRRAGLNGDRSSLFFEAMRIIKEMRDAHGKPDWIVWENVAGALSSSRGADFRAVIEAMADAGAVVIEWAVLDARWFGVPQRRRRVFVVACFDPRAVDRCPDPLLPVGPRRARDLDEGDEEGQGAATAARGGAPQRVRAGGVEGELTPRVSQAVTAKWAKGTGGHAGLEYANLVPFVKAKRAQTDTDDETWAEAGPDRPGPTLNAMDNGSESRATVISVHLTQDPITSTEVSPALSTGSRHGQATVGVAYPIELRNALRTSGATGVGTPATGIGEDGDSSPTVMASPPPAVAYSVAQRGRDGESTLEAAEADTYNALRAGDGGSSRHQQILTPELAVRRLTPRECERLMGWPDDHTLVPNPRGKPMADSARYRMTGNGVAAPVMAWIAGHIAAAHRALDGPAVTTGHSHEVQLSLFS